MKIKLSLILLFLLIFKTYNNVISRSDNLTRLAKNPNYVNLSDIQGIFIDLKYASNDNFMGENVYGNFNQCYLHRHAAQKLKKAIKCLQKRKPGWQLLVFDGLRPRSVQHKLWNYVKGTPNQSYVANPYKGSIHNYGLAVDLSLINEHGQQLDMGTKYDTFKKLSQPRLEKHFLKTGKLTQAQYKNRLILRQCMTQAGFRQLPNEWWHFDALPGKVVRKKYRIVE